MNAKLDAYRDKRNLRKSREPTGNADRSSGQRRFVIQKHDASSLHYDFRLEADGVLLSWAVPKGLSTDPRDKRLAIQTEDHPTDYIDFEGVIPEGEYGAGAVLVWDTGHYRNLREDDGADSDNMEESLSDGLIEVWLDGEKLKGGYALKRIEEGSTPRWLIIKMKDEHADARRRPTSTQPDSVLSGRSIAELAKETASSVE